MEIRPIQRNGWCRGCDKKLVKDKDIIFHTYSSCNQGMNIIFCMDCLDKIALLKEEYGR